MGEALKIELLNLLVLEKKWIIPVLLPLFRSALEPFYKGRSLDISLVTTTELASFRYNKPLHCSGLTKKSGKPTFASFLGHSVEFDFWKKAVLDIKRAGSFAIVTPDFELVLRQALSLMEQSNKEAFSAFIYAIDTLCFVQDADYRSASHPHYFGTIFLAEQKNACDLAISLIHELAHQELFLLNLVDRLVEEDFDFEMIHAPYQGKLRPPIGRLHSAHALFRMCQFEFALNHPKRLAHKMLLAKTVQSFSLKGLTPFACRMIHEVY